MKSDEIQLNFTMHIKINSEVKLEVGEKFLINLYLLSNFIHINSAMAFVVNTCCIFNYQHLGRFMKYRKIF